MAASVQVGMDSRGVVFLFILIGLSLSRGGQPKSPELTIQPADIIKQGDNVTITCSVSNKKLLEFIRIQRQIDGVFYEISDNQLVKEPYAKTGRYRNVRFGRKNTTTTVQLQIENIQGKDGGNIGCLLLPKGLGAYEDIIVFVPPKTVELHYLQADGTEVAVLDEGRLQLQHDRESAIICKVIVDGSDVMPKVTITLDNKDITSRFEREHATDNKADQYGFQMLMYDATRKYVTDNPDRDWNGKEIRCTATTQHFPPVTAKAKLEILYPPELKCQGRLYAKPGTKDVKIACKGKMHPPPVLATWTFGKKPNRTELQSGEEIGHVRAKQETLGGDEYEFSITITEVKDEHFDKYRILASNGIGDGESLIRLVREGIRSTTVVVEQDTKTGPGGDGTNPPLDPEESAVHGGQSSIVSGLMPLVTLLCALALTKFL